jgi:hypothetical protein
MDWNEVPEGIGGQAGVGVWHEIIEERKATVGTALPDNTGNEPLKDVVAIWHSSKGDEEVEFTQKVQYAQPLISHGGSQNGAADLFMVEFGSSYRWPHILATSQSAI